MKQQISLKSDLPIFAVIVLFHLADVLFAISGGLTSILWLILLVSFVHLALFGLIWYAGTRIKETPSMTALLFEP